VNAQRHLQVGQLDALGLDRDQILVNATLERHGLLAKQLGVQLGELRDDRVQRARWFHGRAWRGALAIAAASAPIAGIACSIATWASLVGAIAAGAALASPTLVAAVLPRLTCTAALARHGLARCGEFRFTAFGVGRGFVGRLATRLAQLALQGAQRIGASGFAERSACLACATRTLASWAALVARRCGLLRAGFRGVALGRCAGGVVHD
jgi:hypothetical protein